ncbi:hypothetical protein ACVPW9_23280, partial [Klebsiella pneumoniae]
TVCVVGKMRDLILQLSKSSIYSTKPLPDEMISEYRVFSCNPFDLLTRRFVPHQFPGSFRYQD